MRDISSLLNVPVVITEKMDGSNTCLMRQECFARSHAASPAHISFSMFKALHANIKRCIPTGVQFFGEWLYAKHSIIYENLPSYFMLFGVRDLDHSKWLSWEAVEQLSDVIGVNLVPTIARNKTFKTEKELKKFINKYQKLPGEFGQREGFVIRHMTEFDNSTFQQCVAKWVRAGHNQIDEHWMRKEVEKNGLR